MSTAGRTLGAIIFGLGLLLVVLPWQVLRLEEKTNARLSMVAVCSGGLLFLAGIGLAFSGAHYLVHRGGGTLWPLMPPRRMVVAGPYAHMQHPIWLGLLLVVCGEVLWMRSALLALYAVIVMILASWYVTTIEEPRLAHRFGADYQAYRNAVPRWLPFPRRGRPFR
jgi:protein-S-isoprenylcysteine O-methyltransferase Ste14